MADRAAKRSNYYCSIIPEDGHGICRCGETMVEEITIVPPPKKRFLTCKSFKDDGEHCRKPWDLAMCVELGRLGGILLNYASQVQTSEAHDQAAEIEMVKGVVPKVVARMEAMFPNP